jgi:exo-1,4-beta-D-glucosaminidase
MKKISIALFLLILLQQSFAQSKKESFRMVLHDGWAMQSSVTDPAGGNQISAPGFVANNWYPVTMPSTIIAALLANHVYDFDPFFGKNFEKLADDKLDHTWWFRKTFELPASEKNKNVVLKLHGINYKANVWLNGKLIADSAQIKGPFRIFNLDVTGNIHYSGANVLAIEILRPFNPNRRFGDLAIDYADWIHYPPDYNGGIVNDVEIKTFNKVGIDYPFVTTHFDLPSLDVAHLTVEALATNYTDEPQDAVVKGKINNDIHFEQTVHLLPNEKKAVRFSANDFKQLNISNPKIWWPWQYGQPELNRIEISCHVNHEHSNSIEENFGIREITSAFINNRARVFIVNGKRILLRGAAWSPDIFQRHSLLRDEQELKLVRDMNMNIVRSEGKFEDDNFYDVCDREGLLVMTGWMCCGAWQYPENWDAAERALAMSSDSSMMYWLRNKACIMAWLNGSDMPPRDAGVEKDYLTIEDSLNWPNPLLATADASESKVSGFSGVKMNGPYDWVPPIYWETDPEKYGGAWSFATEISPGPSIPPYESLVKFLSKDQINNTSDEWLYHCGTMQFGNTKIFDSALDERYGASSGIHEYLAKAQLQNYEGHRAMMEAYGLKKYHTATGVVQWMLANPWPSLIWHTYDYYLYPAGTYFGMKKSMEPLHVMYSYASHNVNIINSLLKNFDGLTVKADVYDLDGVNKFSKTISTHVDADSVQTCFAIPPPDGMSGVYFLRLELKDASQHTKSINWYWLSKKDDVLNWNKSKWYYTPQSSFADFSSLKNMPAASVDVAASTIKKEKETVHAITLKNTGNTVAFFVHVRCLQHKGGDDILPVIFSDNYISLAPGESRTIECSYENKYAEHNAVPYISVSGWNLDASTSKAGKDIGFEGQ